VPPTFALYRLIVDLETSVRTIVMPLAAEPQPGDVVELPNGHRCVVREIVPAREDDTVTADIYADIEH
jgi:hypothetical protein